MDYLSDTQGNDLFKHPSVYTLHPLGFEPYSLFSMCCCYFERDRVCQEL